MSKPFHRVKMSWQPDQPDFRDHAFEISKPVPLAKQIDLRPGMPPVYDQGDLGSCTSNALLASFDFARKKEGKSFITPSRLFNYYNERVMEGSIQSDSGAQLRDGIKSLVRQGVCPESEWPYDLSKFADTPTPECYTSALKFQALSYKRIYASLNSMIYCLAGGFPFVFGFSVYDSFESDTVAKTGIVQMPDYGEGMIGGHAVLAVGYNMETRMFLARNSWSKKWGLDGYFWMPFDYVANSDLADDRWTIKLVE